MKGFCASLFLLFSIFSCKGESLLKWYKKSFRGIEISGFKNNSYKTLEVGIVLRSKNFIAYQSARYYIDESFELYGLGGSLLRIFPISNSIVTPLLQYSSSLNHAKSKSNTDINNSVFNEVSLSLGGGLLIELSKYFQIGSSLNYEMVGVFGQKAYFNLRPLVTFKYEFKF
jgi:hypothetical protein